MLKIIKVSCQCDSKFLWLIKEMKVKSKMILSLGEMIKFANQEKKLSFVEDNIDSTRND